MADEFNKQQLALDLARRKRCRTSLHSYALNIQIPTSPHDPVLPDESVCGPAADLMARHHAAILSVVERTINRLYGRAIIMAPPGCAKSTYTSVVMPPWVMQRKKNQLIILTSYASRLAERQSRRARGIVQQKLNLDLWEKPVEIIKDADSEWTLSNGSALLAAGITAGITGNRADGIIIDDPVAGREEADSPLVRKKILDAYQDDLLTRLKPGAWLILIMTRWNEQDLAGEILPIDYKGQSGKIICRDGLEWEVLNLPARAEHHDDPLGRTAGEYLWPEYTEARHWQLYENAQGPTAARAWASLYQQRPTPQGAGEFKREMINLYDGPQLPKKLAKVLISDWAVTEGKNDFTEHAVWGLDPDDNLWELDWWHQQVDTGKGMAAMFDMVGRHKIKLAFNEGGVIDKAIRPAVNAKCRDTKMYFEMRSMPSVADKTAKCASFIARASVGKVYMRRNSPNTERVILQLLAMPSGRYDDAADICGLVGRAVDQWHPPLDPPIKRKEGIKPFTAAWLEYEEPDRSKELRYR
jgi:predicted phage terminase large subunit-like protein